MHSMLQRIIQKKKEEMTYLKKRDFYHLFSKKRMVVIGELKFASPSGLDIHLGHDLITQATLYEKAGIDAVSVITEKHFFKGDRKFIPQVKQAVNLPILQKDFIIDQSQIYEAKAIGSDAILLIARTLSKKTLQSFVSLAQKLAIEPVVEIHDERDLHKALVARTRIIAVNARDLGTFAIDIKKACALIKKIPHTYVRLAFSGIFSHKEVDAYKKAGAQGVLIGIALMRAKNITNFIGGLGL